MRSLTLSLALIASLGTLAHATPGANTLSGDYVEARTASVFAGACHYNGELVTAGREAEMAWSIRSGSWNGVSLKGLAVMAAISSDKNLKDNKAKRRSVIYLDEKASKEQEMALLSALKSHYKASLGEIVGVKRVSLVFKREKDSFLVESKGLTKMVVKAMPNGECCKMPNQVWYEPLVAVKNRKVGYTETSGIKEKSLNLDWSKEGENSAIYGTFSLE